jgi:dTDP-4-amino-4,6-dideoxygalactose transaminase
MGMETNIKSKNKFKKKYYAIEHGTNSRLDEVQASILNVKLNFIKNYINRTTEIAKIYSENLKNTELLLPKETNYNFHVFYQYVVRHSSRNRIIKSLIKKNIGISVVYPYPIHTMKPYRKFYNKKYKNLKNTEFFSNQIFSLPTYPGIKDSNIDTIIRALKKLT